MNSVQNRHLKDRLAAATTAMRDKLGLPALDSWNHDPSPDEKRASKALARARSTYERIHNRNQARRRTLAAKLAAKVNDARRPVDEAMACGNFDAALSALKKFERVAKVCLILLPFCHLVGTILVCVA